MSDPRTLASQALWRSIGDLERRLDALEASLMALCGRLTGDTPEHAAMQRADAAEACSEAQEVRHA